MFTKFKETFVFSSLSRLVFIFLIVISLIYYITSTIMTHISIQNVTAYATQVAKSASDIIKHNGDDPRYALQKFVDDEVRESKGSISYAVIIDRNVQAIAHSDHHKIGKIYHDDYTIKVATEALVMHEKFYADVQKIWTYDIMVPIMINDQQVASLDVGFPISAIDSLIFSILKFLMLVSFIFLVLLVFVQNFLSAIYMRLTVKFKDFCARFYA